MPLISHASQATPNTELRNLLIEAINESSSFNDRFEAEVWLTDMSQRLASRIKEPQERITLLKLIHHEATRAELYPEVVLAVIEIESNFDRYAISRSGARGLMQVMPFWLKEIGRPDDNLFHMQTNLRMGCTILRYYLDKEKGNLRKALARYNGSAGKRKYPDKIFNVLNKRWYRQ
jgi:soluble lytic murein transglycosylase-like protein